MIRFLFALTLVLFFSQSVNARLSDALYTEYLEGCYIGAEAKDDFSIKTRKMCLCMANLVDENFNDEDLIYLYNNPSKYEQFIKETVKPRCKK